MLDRTALLMSADPARRYAWAILVAHADALPLHAPSLADARAVLSHLRPDLIVLDAALPPADARALRRTMRTHPRLARVPLLLVWPALCQETAEPTMAAPLDALAPDTLTRVWHAPLPLHALLSALHPVPVDTPPPSGSLPSRQP